MFCGVRWMLVLLGAVMASGSILAQGKSDQQLQKMLDDWTKRQQRLKTARYVLTGTVEYKQFPSDVPKPTGDLVRPVNFQFLLDIERKRFWLEKNDIVLSTSTGYEPRLGTIAYDGGQLYTLTHRERNGFQHDLNDLGISKGQLPGQLLDTVLRPVLHAHGFVQTVHHLAKGNQFPTMSDPGDYEIQGKQRLNSRDCLVARTVALAAADPLLDEFWIDPSQEGAIHRWVSIVGQEPWERLDVKWHLTDHGWQPESWSLTWTANKQVQRIYKLRVTSFEANPKVTDSEFVCEAKPGMKVRVVEHPAAGVGLDPRYPASRTYRISPSGSWDELSAKGFTTVEGVELPPERGTWVWWAIGIGGAVVTVTIMGILYRRHRCRETVKRPELA